MIEVRGDAPSYIIIIPGEYDFGRNSRKIIGNWMSDSGILTASSTGMFGKEGYIRFYPKDPETNESFIAFEHFLSDSNLAVALDEIRKRSDKTREELRRVFGEDLFERISDRKGHFWEHIFRMSKTHLLDGRPEFNESASFGQDYYRIMSCQRQKTTELLVEASSYNTLDKTSNRTIEEISRLLGANPETGEGAYQH